MSLVRKMLSFLEIKNNTDVTQSSENITVSTKQIIDTPKESIEDFIPLESNCDSKVIEEQIYLNREPIEKNILKQNTLELEPTPCEQIIEILKEETNYDNEIDEESERLKPKKRIVNNSKRIWSATFNKKTPYRSNRILIQGLPIVFIDVAREIIENSCVSEIALMREYRLDSSTLKEILDEMHSARMLDEENNIIMDSDSFEHLLDIYNPKLFDCPHCVFDKDIFMCIGEIIFEDGIEKTYNIMPPDEVLDYLNIMEKLNLISYDNYSNNYIILCDKQSFIEMCNTIPDSYASKTFTTDSNYDCSLQAYDSMNGKEFENFCAHVLSQNNFKDVKLTPASGDHGIDILAEKDDISYAVQCKCYSSNIGNSAVQQAHTGKSLYHKDIAVVLTNRYFTQQAIEEAKALGVKLWDRDKLDSMIKNSIE